jgi:hypothetical protein
LPQQDEMFNQYVAACCTQHKKHVSLSHHW